MTLRDTLELTVTSPTGGRIHVGDVGTVLNAAFTDGTSAVNISTATLKSFLVEDPAGVAQEWTLSFVNSGSDGLCDYTTIVSDFDVAGRWKFQGYIEMPTAKFHTNIVYLTVYPNLVDPT